MRSRPIALAGVTAISVAVLAGGVSPAQAATFTSKCQKGSTLAVGKSARVFSAKKNGTPRVYGCATGSNKRSYLGKRGGEGVDVSVLAVFGPRVAYVRTACAETGCQQSVIVRNLKTREDLSNSEAYPADDETKVTDIVLGAKGVVAWIGQQGDPIVARGVFVKVPGAPVVTIAAGLNIVTGSLALAAKRLYWTQVGAHVVVLP